MEDQQKNQIQDIQDIGKILKEKLGERNTKGRERKAKLKGKKY